MSNLVTPKTNNNSPKRIWSVILLALPFFFMSTKCQKEKPEPQEPTLPEATQTGANTFGCKVNGKVYLPNGNVFYPSMDEPKYYQDSGTVWLRTRNLDFLESEDGLYIYIYIKNGTYQTGIYPGYENDMTPCMEKLVDTTLNNGQQISGSYKYYLDSTQNHFIEITRLDIDNQIISGLFEFTCFNESLQDTFKVTEGRFDLSNVIINP